MWTWMRWISRSQRGMATEYVVLLVLVFVAALVMYGRFGSGLGGKVDEAGQQVGSMGVEPGGSAGVAGSGGRGGGSGSSSGGGASEPESLPERIDEQSGPGKESLDTRMVVLLGIGVMAIGALMIVAIANRIRKETKRQKKAAKRGG